MDFNIIITDQAVKDLCEIADFIGADNPEAATNFCDKLIDHSLKLTRFPERGRVLQKMKDPLIREVIYRSYRIVYKIDPRFREVYIARFWHSARGEPTL